VPVLLRVNPADSGKTADIGLAQSNILAANAYFPKLCSEQHYSYNRKWGRNPGKLDRWPEPGVEIGFFAYLLRAKLADLSKTADMVVAQSKNT